MPRALLLSLLLISSPTLLAQSNAAFSEQVCDEHNQCLTLKNQAVLTYLWVEVYTAAFYTTPGVSAQHALREQDDVRLELHYLRRIDRKDVIKAALVTLERQLGSAALADLADGLQALHARFKDIEPGDHYALNYGKGGTLALERNGQRIFTSTNAQLAKAYLGIWMAPDGLSAELRNELLKN